MVARAPIFGAKVKSFDDSRARSMPGVRKIAQVPSGVAVVADTFWQAKVARDALRVEWDEGAMHNFSTTQLMQQFRERAKSPGVSVRKEGDAPAAAGQRGEKHPGGLRGALSFPSDDGASELRGGPALGFLRGLDGFAVSNHRPGQRSQNRRSAE